MKKEIISIIKAKKRQRIYLLLLAFMLISCSHTDDNHTSSDLQKNINSNKEIEIEEITYLNNLYKTPKPILFQPAHRNIGIARLNNKSITPVELSEKHKRVIDQNNKESSRYNYETIITINERFQKEKELWNNYAKQNAVKNMKLIGLYELQAKYGYKLTQSFSDTYETLLKVAHNEKLDYLILYDSQINTSSSPTLYTKTLENTLELGFDSPYTGGILFIPAFAIVGATSWIPMQEKKTTGSAYVYIIDINSSAYSILGISPENIKNYRSILFKGKDRYKAQNEMALLLTKKVIKYLQAQKPD